MQQQAKDKPGAPPAPPPEIARRWLSEGLEILLHELQQQPRAEDGFDVDVLIVGSGYGGAAAAAELSRCPGQRIVVLERGREYLAGQFPERMADLPGHVRFATPAAATPSGRWEGLFDLRLGPDVNVVLANGLGGGSLINAGVMEPRTLGRAVRSAPGSRCQRRAGQRPGWRFADQCRRDGAGAARGVQPIALAAGAAPGP
ncbi:NAD(P)-binding protein [Paucibacter sp. XJ19-41]|uniref:NAD(P)-binding protein n=1 Tax=Paucibacter sp. XJ19-41 TaxID=2927824 RepID=UPI00234A81B7|nr:NAD(P)-binding protein [Paucibacter sp. XJ19-41]MDC6169721.1 NAD(P)-binding protein [Paucibacter sp. XJ19-41]